MSDETTTPEVAGETSADTPTAEAATVEAPAAPEVRDPAKLLSAYEAEKAKRKETDAALRDIRSEFDAFRAKADGKEAEFTAAQEAQRAQDAMLAKANERIVSSELRLAAKGKVNDDVLGDLTKFINPSDFEVGDDGSVNEAAIAAAIDDLIRSRPSFVAQSKRFQGTADGGARNGSTKPSQLTRADLAGMSPEQTEAARAEGRFDDLLSGK
jgi:hypothetical protein